MELSSASFAILAAGVFLGFFVQTIIGFAATAIALPILVFAMGLKQSIALMAIYLFAFSIILIWKNWKQIDRKVFSELLVPGALGLAIGTYFLAYGNAVILKKALGIFVIIIVFYSFFSKNKIRAFNRFGHVFGFAGGLFSGLFNTGGPVYATYIGNKLDNPKIVRATIIGLLTVSNFLRIPFLVYGGVITYDLLLKAIFMTPFFLFSIYLGHKFFNKLNDAMFKNIFMFFLFLSGLSLLF